MGEGRAAVILERTNFEGGGGHIELVVSAAGNGKINCAEEIEATGIDFTAGHAIDAGCIIEKIRGAEVGSEDGVLNRDDSRAVEQAGAFLNRAARTYVRDDSAV